MIEKIFASVDARLPEFKELLREVIEQDSYSYDKEDVDKVGEIIRNYAQAQGWNVHVEQFEKAGNGLLITMNDGAPMLPVAFTGHMDTVFPRGTFAKPMFREENGRFYGPGVFDMKGSIVMTLLAMRALADAGYQDRQLRLILIGDEEVSEGLSGEKGINFIKESARGSAAALTVEGGLADDVIVGRKGSLRYKVRVQGKPAHAGLAYAEGISAIKEAAQKILAIEAASDPEQITYNCGLISGGTSANTVPEFCEFNLYNRYWTYAQREEIRAHVEGIIEKSFIPGTKGTFEIIGGRPPMEPAPANYALAAHINQTAAKYGLPQLTARTQAAGSDASYTAMAGVPSVCTVGLRGEHPHELSECAEAESLPQFAKLLAATIAELPEDFGKKENAE